jgi:hypothetical protein
MSLQVLRPNNRLDQRIVGASRRRWKVLGLLCQVAPQFCFFRAAAVLVFASPPTPAFAFGVQFEMIPPVCRNFPGPKPNPLVGRMNLPDRVWWHPLCSRPMPSWIISPVTMLNSLWVLHQATCFARKMLTWFRIEGSLAALNRM